MQPDAVRIQSTTVKKEPVKRPATSTTFNGMLEHSPSSSESFHDNEADVSKFFWI
jgi:hypothetical protein